LSAAVLGYFIPYMAMHDIADCRRPLAQTGNAI
jgi:hypothetical protein